MSDIVALLHCLTPYLSNRTMRQMKHIVFAVLCIPDHVTMLNIARWAERGGSYRTIQRWYHTPLDWAAMLWSMVRIHLLKPEGEYLLAGKTTHGPGRFYSSLAQGPINSVSFMTVSLIDVQARRSYPLQVEQREPHVPAGKPVEPLPKRQRGRPKGSQNHVKPAPPLTPDLSLLDLKAQFRARRYLDETIKMLPDPPGDDFVSRIWRRLTALGGIRVRQLDRFAT